MTRGCFHLHGCVHSGGAVMGRDARLRVRRVATAWPRGSEMPVTEVRRSWILDAASASVAEHGSREMVMQDVSGRLGTARTVEDLLSSREDCLLAAFDSGIGELAAAIAPAWWSERGWEERIRACLAVLLAQL